MAAYAALRSLAQTTDLDRYQGRSLFPSKAEEKVRSINGYVDFLLWFFERFPQKASRWEGRIRGVAYKTEDIIEVFIGQRIQRHPSRVKLEDQLENVTEEIGLIAGEVTEERPKYVPASSSRVASTGNDAVIGLDNDIIALKERLCGHPSDLQVIPIVGMGGIGKTTLARTLYDSQLIIERFDIRAWVVVSQDYSPRRFWKSLFESMKLIEEQLSGDEMDESEFGLKVYQTFKGRRYLVVFDDVWGTHFWDDVNCMFPDDKNGSRIMLTTRQLDAAVYPCSAGPVHEMQFMNDSQSWDLLKQNVFTDSHCPSYLEDIGKEIARRCAGLPLAVVLVAGVLSPVNKTRPSWEKIAEDVNPVVGREIEEILLLSYTYLPHHLRPCFLFIGGFLEDVNIRTSRLIRLWVAEGFLKHQNGCSKSLEEEAEEYLEDLVKRNLVIVASRKSDGKIKSCSLHDMVREMCIRKANDEEFLHVMDGRDLPQGLMNERRISFSRSDVGDIRGPTFRTILCFQIQNFSSWLTLFGSSKLLRVLDALGADIDEIPSKVFELYHIRYIALMGSFSIPSAISNLVSLQTLIIHLPVGNIRRRIDDDDDDVFQSLPLEIWSMPQLRHLFFHSPQMLPHPPDGLNLPLKNLQTLLLVANLIWNEKILQMIPDVRRLGLTYTIDQEYHLHHLKDLRQLEKLKVIGCQPFSWRGKNPSFPCALRKLTLVGGGFPWEDMAIVGSLPNLEILKLLGNACNGVTWETNDEDFPQLKFLLIDESDLRQWITHGIPFPKLKRLVLRSFLYLKEIPEDIGEIPTLELIEVTNCTNSLVKSAMKIKEDQENCGNYDLQVCASTYESIVVRMFDSISRRPGECITKVLESFLSKMVDHIADDALNKGKNIMGFELILKTLQKNLKSLSAKASDVKKEIENAERSGRKKRKQEVEEWLEEVKYFEDEVAELGSQVESEGFIERLIDGGKAAHLNEQVHKLVEQSRNFGELVLDDFGEAFNENLERVLELLERRQVSSIGIYGMGGVGKSTLAKHIHNRLLKEQSVGRVFWIVVSSEFTIKSLQDKIARLLSVNLSDEDDGDTRAAILHSVLSLQRNSVLILDDVWEQIDLLKLGCRVSVEFCRLIVTTRSSEVCRRIHCQEIIKVSKLGDDEAWRLFNKTLGIDIELDPQVEEIAKPLVKVCGGLPLGIITMAGSMRGETDIRMWRTALAEQTECVVGQDGRSEVDEVFKVLKYSFDRLNKNHQSRSNEFSMEQLCFLYCSLYREDYEIDIEDLVRKFISEGLMNKRERRAEVDQGHSILDKLVKVCLLESCVDNRGHKCVKMHDLIRGMALKIGEGKYMVRAGNWSLKEIPDEQEWTKGLEKVSLMNNYIERIGNEISPSCPKLSALLLNENPLKVIPDSFFSKMQGLCTLDLCYTHIKILPDSICDMKCLEALLLAGCGNLEYVPYLGKLKSMRELNLSGTAIKEVPGGVEELLNLKFLSMEECELEMLPSGLFLKLVKLQYVNFPFHIQVSMEEVQNLKQVEEFIGRVKNVKDFNWLIENCKLYSYNIRVGSHHSASQPDFWTFSPDNKVLSLYECNLQDEIVLGQEVVDLIISKSEGLRIYFADDLSQFSNPTSLRSLSIEHCAGIEWILKREEGLPSQFSETLETILLKDLKDLRGMIEKGEIGTRAAQPVFSSLTRITIHKCNKMKLGIPASGVPNLENIHIKECGEIEEIFEDEGRDSITLPKLRWLQFVGLSRLRKVGLPLSGVPNLENIYIKECGEIEEIFEDEGRDSITLPELQLLILEELPKLKRVCKATMIGNKIFHINIEKCPILMNRLPMHVDDPPQAILGIIKVEREWWESLEWDNPNLPQLLHRMVQFIDGPTP